MREIQTLEQLSVAGSGQSLLLTYELKVEGIVPSCVESYVNANLSELTKLPIDDLENTIVNGSKVVCGGNIDRDWFVSTRITSIAWVI